MLSRQQILQLCSSASGLILECYVPVKSVKGNKYFKPWFFLLGIARMPSVKKKKPFQKWLSSRLECDRVAFTKLRSKKIIPEAKSSLDRLASCPDRKRAFCSSFKTINRKKGLFSFPKSKN